VSSACGVAARRVEVNAPARPASVAALGLIWSLVDDPALRLVLVVLLLLVLPAIVVIALDRRT
jgi:hypothetical protein